MIHLTRGIQSIFKKRYFVKTASIAIIAILLVSSLYVVGSIFSTPSDQHQHLEDGTTLTLALQQTKDYTYKGVTYKFKYIQGSESNLLQVSTGGQTSINYPAIPGITYEIFNLKVTIHTANEQTLIILITPS
jgi:hypothetical protein